MHHSIYPRQNTFGKDIKYQPSQKMTVKTRIPRILEKILEFRNLIWNFGHRDPETMYQSLSPCDCNRTETRRLHTKM